MIQVALTSEDIDRAWEVNNKLDDQGYKHRKINKSGQDYTMIGLIGEQMISKTLDLRKVESFDFDFKDEEDRTFEIKTQQSKVVPFPDYRCKVLSLKKSQATDFYIFCTLNDSWKYGFIIGYIPNQLFHDLRFFVPKGNIHYSKTGIKFTNSYDHWAIEAKDLRVINRDHFLVRVDNFVENRV